MNLIRPIVSRWQGTTIGAYLFCLALAVFATIYSSGFLDGGHVQVMLVFASFIGFAALGQTLVILAGGLDLSVPWLVALGGLQLSVWSGGIPDLPAVVILLLIGAAIGTVSGLGVVLLDIPPIIMTLGVGGVVQAYLIHLSEGSTSKHGVGGIIHDLVTSDLGPIPAVAIVWLVVAVLAGIGLARSATGRRIYAVGSREAVARIAGVRVGRVRVATYALSGAASVLTGMLLAGYTGQAFLGMGEPYLFSSIAAMVVGGGAILGGRGSYWGTVAGALTLMLLGQILPMFNLDEAVLSIVYGIAILIGVSLAQSAVKTVSVDRGGDGEDERAAAEGGR